MSTLVQNQYRAAGLKWSILMIGLALSLGALVATPRANLLVIGCAVIALSIFLAVKHPMATAALFVLLESARAQTGDLYDSNGLTIRLTDPLLVGVILATALWWMRRGVGERGGARFAMFGLLMVWIGVIVILNMPRYGVATLTELRTYYQPLVLFPYLGIAPITTERRARALSVIALGSIMLVVIGLIRLSLGAELQLGVRVVSAAEALGLLFSGVALFVLNKYRLLSPRSWMFGRLLLALGAGTILFTAHRSVWLASLVAVLALLLLREVRVGSGLGRLAVLGGGGLLVAMLALGALGQEDASTFASERTTAFVNPQADATASWREHLWQQSLDRIKVSPLYGVGLGRYFDLTDPSGESVTTSPHNLYISIAYEFGIPGLVLYLAFLLFLLLHLRRARRSAQQTGDSSTAALATIGMCVLVAAHAFYIAYPIENDWMTWLFAGVVASLTAVAKPGSTSSLSSQVDRVEG